MCLKTETTRISKLGAVMWLDIKFSIQYLEQSFRENILATTFCYLATKNC